MRTLFGLTLCCLSYAASAQFVIIERGDVVDTASSRNIDARDMRIDISGSMRISSLMRQMVTGTVTVQPSGTLTMAGGNLNIVDGSFRNRGGDFTALGGTVSVSLNTPNTTQTLSGLNAYSGLLIDMLGAISSRGAGGGFADAPTLRLDADNPQTIQNSFTINSNLQRPLKLRSSIDGRAAILRLRAGATATAGVVEVRDVHVSGGELCVAQGSRILGNVQGVRVCEGQEIFKDQFETL